MPTNPSESECNNPVTRSSQNKAQLLEAMMRNVPKLKELNYTQWKNIITNSIKKAKLWEYVDGSIEEPSEHDASNLTTYYDEATAVRNAILGSLEPVAQRYIEEALDPREAWLTLEKKYLTAEAETDSKLASIEKQLVDLRLEEEGDMVEHITQFCRMRCQLSGTPLAIDDQTCISMLYRSLPPSFRQSVLTPEGAEMKDFNALCARLTYLSQNPEPAAPVDDTPPVPAEDFTTWGVPEDIKAFGLTGDKNPLLEERAAVTCRDCLLKDHKAGTPECPQYEWRKELWGTKSQETAPETSESGKDLSAKQPAPASSNRLSYEFSEPVKVVLTFDELGLKPQLRQSLLRYSQPSVIQQCAILPIIQGRNVLAQAPSDNGKTTALVISALQVVDSTLPCVQVLVFTSTVEAAAAFQKAASGLGSGLSILCSSDGTSVTSLARINKNHIFVGIPATLLGLVRRSIINLHKLKAVFLDDIDKLMESGMEDQILGVYRHVPPLAQVVASSTVFFSSISTTITKLLADPLQVLVNHNKSISIGTHCYVMVPGGQKPNVLSASFSALGVNGLALLCRDLTEITHNNWSIALGFYYLQESMQPSQWANLTQNFASNLSNIRACISRVGYYNGAYGPVSNVILATSDAALSTARLPSVALPLVNYDVPSNVEDYIKRLDHWRLADPGLTQMIITFVTADTEEINVIRDLERHYGVRSTELLWDGESKTLY
ncbi:hypothetical protein ACGC1H_000371 [Rhizoctonia solani]|uniref:ATP-dependent RNA helicase n=1 Tax=Rhizoctonia solani TaxID=456999 RepID=A0A8H3BI00_9AGAM|nr:unnamed protein product [Rhizoctonia solani]